jgi:hypothetical protein
MKHNEISNLSLLLLKVLDEVYVFIHEFAHIIIKERLVKVPFLFKNSSVYHILLINDIPFYD